MNAALNFLSVEVSLNRQKSKWHKVEYTEKVLFKILVKFFISNLRLNNWEEKPCSFTFWI